MTYDFWENINPQQRWEEKKAKKKRFTQVAYHAGISTVHAVQKVEMQNFSTNAYQLLELEHAGVASGRRLRNIPSFIRKTKVGDK